MAPRILQAWTRINNPRRLSTKLGFNLSIAGVTGFLAIILFTGLIISHRFGALEQRDVQVNVSRTQAMLKNLMHLMQGKTLDWAIWTDSYTYISNQNHAFEDGNLNNASLKNYDVNAIYYVRFDKTLNHGKYIDLPQEEENVAKSALMKAYIGSPLILARAKSEPNFQTFVRFGDKLLVMGFAQVLMNDGSGTPRGFVAIGREIEPNAIGQQLQQKAHYSFNLIKTPYTATFSEKIINVGVSVPGVDGKPLSTIEFPIDRDVAVAGRNMLLVVAVGIASMLVTMIALLNWRLRTTVVRPLVTVERHVRGIGETGQLSLLPYDGRQDEIGTLQTGFNAMTEQLLALRSQLDAQSFELGKNQSAIGVMHNIRNGLSPVFTILSRMNEHLHVGAQENIGRALSELGQDELDSIRRQKLSAFLAAAMNQYDQQLGFCRAKLHEAGRGLSTVLEAIEQVQAEDRATPEISNCDMADVIASSLATTQYMGSKAIHVDQDEGGPHIVRANRVLLSQVVVNLLTNASEAIAATGHEDGNIRVSMTRSENEKGPVLNVFIRDDGDGFEPDKAASLFERGYSTRPDKTGGLGLHWCANTINAMGGSLMLTSTGPGMGATAILAMPISSGMTDR
jgi:signal transduction histidine kinase